MTDRVHLLVFDGFADWEPSYALAELRRSGRREVATVGFDARPVTSMGGLRVVPDRVVGDVRDEEVEILIAPGGDAWEREDGYPRADVEALFARVLGAGRPLAAICAATVALARAGLLDDRRHTSNGPTYLSELVPSYRGAPLYDSAPAVRDRGLVTASGLGAVDFARAIFDELGVFSAADSALWFDMFKHGKLPPVAT